MLIVAQLLFGWPAIIIFIALATTGVWLVRANVLAVALFFALGPSLYLIGAANWVQFMGLYIPLSIGISIALVRQNKPVMPRVLLVPIYCFYTWFGYMVATQ